MAHVETAQPALAETERCQPHLALLDLGLSDIAASEVLRQVREKKLRSKCAILATKKERKTVLEAPRYGASGYVMKTAAPQQMAEALRHMMEGAFTFLLPST